jgi:hypothetical protein
LTTGALDLSQISNKDVKSLNRENILIDFLDRQSQIKKYEIQLKAWDISEDFEQIDSCLSLIDMLRRPWDIPALVENKPRISGEELMEQYAARFPEALKKEK